MKLPAQVLQRARALVASRLGLDFPESRQADLERGILRAIHTGPIQGPEEYLVWLSALPVEDPELLRLAGHLTVGETYFFRDRALFDALERQVLPALITTRRAEGIPRLRLWSAGCATGEEPYSLAILMDRLLPDRADWRVTILATDISPEALKVAYRGRYRDWALRETPARIRGQHFHHRGQETFELDARIRQMVTFGPLNLAAEGYPSALTNTVAIDLILCRNVLMYFTQEAQRIAVIGLQRALLQGGWLAVSPAEASADLFRPLCPVNFPGAIFFRKEDAAAISRAPSGWSSAVSFEHAAVSRQPSAVSFRPEMEEIAANAGMPDASLPAAAPSQPPTPNPQPPISIPQSPLDRARVFANRGDLDQARHLCEAALAQDRLNPEIYLLLAAICQELGEIPAAREALRRVIYLTPHFAPAHFLLGSLLLRRGQRRRGLQSMETVVGLLRSAPRDEPVPGGDGLTAGRLLESARAYLE